MKEEASDYLELETIKNLVKKYSQFINFPIYVWSSKVSVSTEEVHQQLNQLQDFIYSSICVISQTETVEEPIEEEEAEPEKEETTEDEAEVEEEDEDKDKPKTKKVT